MNTATTTNATDTKLATELSGISTDGLGVGQGTMVSIIVKKKGSKRGSLSYDNATVHVLVWTGFHYRALVERSHQKLTQLWESGTLVKDLLKEIIDRGIYDATLADASEAIQETNESFLRILRADPANVISPWTGDDAHASSWEPLKVNGEPVLGAKVYVGTSKNIARGTVYLDGVKLGEKIVEPAQYSWPTKHKNKTIMKEMLRDKLPIGLYARYSLDSSGLKVVKVGNDAVIHAKAEGVPIDPAAIRSLFKIAT